MVIFSENIEKITHLISQIPDPEIPVITIKDLGILRDIKFEGDVCIVTITPTYTGCPAMGLIEDEIKNILLQYGYSTFRIDLVYSPAWTTDWIHENAKKKMKVYGISVPTHSSCLKDLKHKEIIICPLCQSNDTQLISRFGSTACKSLHKCLSCKEPFEHFKCH